jgi:hypothetical protein
MQEEERKRHEEVWIREKRLISRAFKIQRWLEAYSEQDLVKIAGCLYIKERHNIDEAMRNIKLFQELISQIPQFISYEKMYPTQYQCFVNALWRIKSKYAEAVRNGDGRNEVRRSLDKIWATLKYSGDICDIFACNDPCLSARQLAASLDENVKKGTEGEFKSEFEEVAARIQERIKEKIKEIEAKLEKLVSESNELLKDINKRANDPCLSWDYNVQHGMERHILKARDQICNIMNSAPCGIPRINFMEIPRVFPISESKLNFRNFPTNNSKQLVIQLIQNVNEAAATVKRVMSIIRGEEEHPRHEVEESRSDAAVQQEEDASADTPTNAVEANVEDVAKEESINDTAIQQDRPSANTVDADVAEEDVRDTDIQQEKDVSADAPSDTIIDANAATVTGVEGEHDASCSAREEEDVNEYSDEFKQSHPIVMRIMQTENHGVFIRFLQAICNFLYPQSSRPSLSLKQQRTKDQQLEDTQKLTNDVVEETGRSEQITLV